MFVNVIVFHVKEMPITWFVEVLNVEHVVVMENVPALMDGVVLLVTVLQFRATVLTKVL